jgi:transposase
MKKRKITICSLEFKQSSAKLAIDSEQPYHHIAKELGLHPTTLYG